MKETIQIVKPCGDLLLSPCPFCGGRDVAYEEYATPVGPRWRVVCFDCMAGIDPGWAQARSAVQSMWNRRTPAEDERNQNAE